MDILSTLFSQQSRKIGLSVFLIDDMEALERFPERTVSELLPYLSQESAKGPVNGGNRIIDRLRPVSFHEV